MNTFFSVKSFDCSVYLILYLENDLLTNPKRGFDIVCVYEICFVVAHTNRVFYLVL